MVLRPDLGSVSSRECLDAPAILATFTAGRTGLVACPWRHYNFNNYADNPHVICLNFIWFFFIVLKKSEMRKVCLKCPPKSVKFQEKDEIPLNYVAHSAPQISGGLPLIGQSKQYPNPSAQPWRWRESRAHRDTHGWRLSPSITARHNELRLQI